MCEHGPGSFQRYVDGQHPQAWKGPVASWWTLPLGPPRHSDLYKLVIESVQLHVILNTSEHPTKELSRPAHLPGAIAPNARPAESGTAVTLWGTTSSSRYPA